jgi:hypothetical protein
MIVPSVPHLIVLDIANYEGPIWVTQAQLEADLAHLRQLRQGLHWSRDTIERAHLTPKQWTPIMQTFAPDLPQ